MIKVLKLLLLSLVVALGLNLVTEDVNAYEETISASVGYQVKAGDTWQDLVFGGALAGSEGGSNLQSLAVHLTDAPEGASVQTRIYSAGAWSDWSHAYQGTPDANVISGLQIRLTDYANGSVYYQVYRKGLGWGTWVKDGMTAGRLNNAYPITAIRIKVVEVGVAYTSKISSKAYSRANAETLGSGLIETFSARLQKAPLEAKISYRVHFHDWDWSQWVSNGNILGKSGSGKWIEAIEVKLENMPGFHVAYQVLVKGQGWTDWVYDGAQAGTTGLTTPIDAYRIKIVKGASAPAVTPIIPAPVEEDLNDRFEGIGANPGTTLLTYNAVATRAYPYDWYRYPNLRTALGIPELTINDQFDDNPAGIEIIAGDKFTAPLISYVDGDRIAIPDTFSSFGSDSTVDDAQFEVLYGTYDKATHVFTVISTRDTNSEEEPTITTETHTMILYDNDPRLVFSDQNTKYPDAAANYTFTTLDQMQVLIGGNPYDYSLISGNAYTANSTTIYERFEASPMILDGFVVEGVKFEYIAPNVEGWQIITDNGSNYLVYNAFFD